MSLETILDGVPPDWDPTIFNNQNQRGPGVAVRFGARPPSPDSVAPRGTPEWRAAFQAQRAWMNNQIFAGATLHDMGFDPERGKGLHAYTALKAGDFAGYGTEPWGNVGPRGYYDSTTGAFTPLQGQGPLPSGGGGQGGQSGFGGFGGGGTFLNGGANRPTMPVPTAPTGAQSAVPSLGGPPALPGPDVTSQASLIRRHTNMPRAAMGLRGLAGG